MAKIYTGIKAREFPSGKKIELEIKIITRMMERYWPFSLPVKREKRRNEYG